jgi:hypothetical protein
MALASFRTVRGRLPIYGNANACRIERLFWRAAAMGKPLPQNTGQNFNLDSRARAIQNNSLYIQASAG